jgi:hypothetical protein
LLYPLKGNKLKNNMKTIFFISISIVLIFSACRKTPKTEKINFKGRVMDAYYGKPVDSALVTILADRFGRTTRSADFDIVAATTYTNDSGYFECNYTIPYGWATGFLVNKAGYYNSTNIGIDASDYKTRSINPIIFYKVHVINSPNVESDDSIYLDLTSNMNLEDYKPINFWFKGKDTTLLTGTVYASSWWHMKYHYYDKGKLYQFISRPSCNPLDTCLINIEF